MAEDHDRESKTEEATEKKIRDSVEKGRVPYSKEAATLASIVAILASFIFLFTNGVIRLRFSLETFIDNPGGFKLENTADAVAVMRAALTEAGLMLLPVLFVISIGGIAASLLQNQPQLAFDRIKPELSRISLIKGWSRIFGLNGQVEFLKSLFKLAIVGAAGYTALASSHRDFVNALFMEPSAINQG